MSVWVDRTHLSNQTDAARVHRGHEVLGFTQDDTSVVAAARGGDGTAPASARYLVDCDGAGVVSGDRRKLDTGSVNGERFAVMAGAGFDARMIADADRGIKDRLGRAAYVITGIRNLGARRVRAGKKFRIRFNQKVVFELDGGARPATKTLRIRVHPKSVTVCVPPRRAA
jgi:diacylglycerol kinase family enzyme